MIQESKKLPEFGNNKWLVVFTAVCSLGLLPLLTYAILIHPPEYDELLHILSARSLSTTGAPAIADGLYTRAQLYTHLIAWVQSFGGDELLMARLPALGFGMLLTSVLTAWVGVRAGWIAGIATAIVFVISPETLHASVLVRFYTFHTLVMALLLILWFEATSWSRSLSTACFLLISSAFLIWLGLQLHELTQITLLAGFSAVLVLLAFDNWQRLVVDLRARPLIWILSFGVVAALMLFLFRWLDVMSLLRGTIPLWSATKANNYAYYVSALSVQLPFIWPLFPLMVVLAFIARPRIAVFCLTTFTVALIVNSIAGQKATRYFYHAFPMLCVLWGLGFQKLLAVVSYEYSRRRGTSFNFSALLFLCLFSLCLVNAHEVKRGLKLVVNKGQMDETLPVRREPDWTLAVDKIGDLATAVDTLVVTSGVKGIYAFGRYDYEMSTTVVQETDTGEEFGLDPRTGRQVIGEADSVQAVIDADGQALFVLEDRMIDQPYSSPRESIAVLKQKCSPIDLTSTESQLSAWLC